MPEKVKIPRKLVIEIKIPVERIPDKATPREAEWAALFGASTALRELAQDFSGMQSLPRKTVTRRARINGGS